MDNLTSNVTSLLTSSEGNDLEDLTFWMDGVATNVVIVLGLIGNVMTSLVLSRRDMQSATGSGGSGSTNAYLRALAAWDSMVLVSSLLLIGLPAVPQFAFYRSHVFAYVHSYFYPLALIAQTATIWLTVAFTLERYVAVCLPLKSTRNSGATRARVVITLVSSASLVYNLPRWFDFRPVHVTSTDTNTTLLTVEYCQGALYTQIYFSWLYALVMCVLPLAILAVFNTCLIVAVRRSTRRRVRMGVASSARENNVTVMLVAVVVVFMVCQVPALVYNVAYAVDRARVETDFRYQVLSHIRNFLVNVNSAVNFLLYCAIGRRFRRTLVRMLRRNSRHNVTSSNRKNFPQQQHQQQQHEHLLMLHLHDNKHLQLRTFQPHADERQALHYKSFTATDRFHRRLHLLISMRAQFADDMVTSPRDVQPKQTDGSSSRENRGLKGARSSSSSSETRTQARNNFHKTATH